MLEKEKKNEDNSELRINDLLMDIYDQCLLNDFYKEELNKEMPLYDENYTTGEYKA